MAEIFRQAKVLRANRSAVSGRMSGGTYGENTVTFARNEDIFRFQIPTHRVSVPASDTTPHD